MRILYHHRTLGDGAEGIHIREIVKSLRNLGHEVKVVALVSEEDMINPQKKEAKPRLYWLKKMMPGFIFELAEIFYNIKGYRMILNTAKTFKPDAVYDRYISYNYSAIRASRKLGVPCILEVNSPYATQRRIWEKIYFPKLIQRYETKITNGADRVIVVSSALRDHLIKNGTDKDKIVVMPNGIDPADFNVKPEDGRLRKKYDITADEIVIGFVGVLRKWHNIETLLEVFRQLEPERRQLRLMFVGDGVERPNFINFARKLSIDKRVIFTGRVPHGEVPDYISLFDLAISPHVTYYSSPMKILEYMGMGKCVVAPDMQNIRDLIEPEKTGVLFKPENKEDIHRQMLAIIKDDKLRDEIGRQAAATVVKNFTWEKNARDVIDLFEQLRV